MKGVIEGLRSKDRATVLASMDELEALLRRSAAGTEAIGPLCEIMGHGQEEERRRAIWCLGKLGQNKVGDPAAIPPLLESAAHPSAENRENTAWALGELAGAGVGSEEALGALVDMLEDPDDHVKAMAAWSLGRYVQKLGIRDPRCLGPLEAMSSSPSTYLAKSAGFALELIKRDPSGES